MAKMDETLDPRHLHAIVDMGSNGIRFSISSLEPPTARIMPTLYQNRAGISLYDAQWSSSGERQPIDDNTINAVINSFQYFQRTCSDFGVPEENITVIATEATRTALNSEDFQKRIKEVLGWDVTLLPKEEEGRVGALGIASSLPEVRGLVMDLGGGSTQLSWLMNDEGDGVRMPEAGAVSLPYGAAAMSRRLAQAESEGTAEELKGEIRSAVKKAFESLEVPAGLMRAADGRSGCTLYLSGGGFRGWGYVLMSRHKTQPYPIPVINGFKAESEEFMKTQEVKASANAALQNEDEEMFRVSDRRASQVPAVAFLISALSEAIPDIKQVRFCQGGVREGYLFSSLSREIQTQQPLVVATQSYSRDSSGTIARLLRDAIPKDLLPPTAGPEDGISPGLLEGFANMMYVHGTHSKDLQASAALRCTTSGTLAGVHGLLHESRAMLALLLSARWGDEVPPVDENFKENLEKLVVSPLLVWILRYLGSVAALIGAAYPAGVPEGHTSRIELSTSIEAKKKAEKYQLVLRLKFADHLDPGSFAKELKGIEKAGKKKNWVGGREGIGYKVLVATDSSSKVKAKSSSDER